MKIISSISAGQPEFGKRAGFQPGLMKRGHKGDPGAIVAPLASCVLRLDIDWPMTERNQVVFRGCLRGLAIAQVSVFA